VLAMGLFHFMQGFLSSGTLGFHCTENKNHEALRQRIIINYTFAGLTREETKEYIISRLKACGVYEPIFEENSYEFIFTSTGGFVRKINNLVNMALISGAKEKLRSINAELMLNALNELNITAS
jgi:general secretion pathway protein A